MIAMRLVKSPLKKRKKLPTRTTKLIFQESKSQCSFCDEAEVSALEIHHIIALEIGGSDGPKKPKAREISLAGFH